MPVTLFHVEDNSFGVPAGWYPDPLGLPQLRWWDAQAWTEHTSDARAPIVVQPSATKLAFADDDDEDDFNDDIGGYPSRRAQRDSERDSSADFLVTETRSEPEPETAPVHDELSAQPLLAMTLRELEAPVDETREAEEPQLLPKSATAHANTMPGASTLSAYAEEEEAPEREIRQHRTYNAAVWLIAILPLVQLLSAMFLIAGAGLGNNLPLLLVVWVAPYIVVLGLAAYDNLLLQVWGHERPANAAWAFLTAPVYLVMRGIRTMRETGKGIAPIATWSATLVSLVIGMLILPGLIISLIPQTFSTQIEDSIQAQAATLGANIELDCPATPPVLIGDTFTCRAVKPDNGQRDSILVSLQRENGWISWRVEDWGLWTLFG
ncbi:uncharacterized protein DUF2510 [Salinibacterium amurskyense]|uniref:Uncharacterized protein DUF2510 n=1 Tax=Salinibacterium amurskyense TaxID=205941 RepID=A0A2M9D700_9MICO|nr:uncharacterized protein DUF2510 [Salinibacterium amurskyense]RLQ83424.1 DUF2510 domain-containing protein [Salinibacterium amurskyense]GHD80521.1 hypothetical protein GCM10007394_12070 [Salinibacterium amurskyense]